MAGERVKRICKHCNKEFEILKCKLKTNASGNFCCRECYNKYLKTLTGEKNKNYNRIIYNCDYCGKELKIIPAKFKDREKHFCNKDCRSKYHIGKFANEKNGNWRGGHKNRKGDFEAVKKKNFKNKQVCAICGSTKKIHIHHIIPFRYTEDNSLNNLIPLCNSCHRKVEIITWDLLDSANWGNFELLKILLNSTLREMQLKIIYTIKEKMKCEKMK